MKKVLMVFLVFVLLFTSIASYADDSAVKVHLENYKELELVDELTFAFKYSGEDAEGELEHYFMAGGTHYYILSISSSDESVALWTSEKAPLDASIAKLSNNIPLQFLGTSIVSDGSLVKDKSRTHYRIHLKCIMSDATVKETRIKYISETETVISNDMTDSIICTDAMYTNHAENDISLEVTFEDRVKPGQEDNSEEQEEVEEKEEKPEEKVSRQDHVGNIKSYILREKFTFTFVADESFRGAITEEVAEIGETVYCESRVYLKEWNSNRTKNRYHNVMTLKGSKGTIDIWGGILYDLDYIPLYKPTDVIMVGVTANRVIKGYSAEPLVRYSGGNWKDDYIRIQAEFDGTEITGMKIKYEPEEERTYREDLYMKDSIDCTSFEYELLVPLEEITEKEKEEEKALEERNPEKYVTKVRGKLRDGAYADYRINSIYEIPLLFSDPDLPQWYENLGDDVKAYLISFTQIIDGKDRRNYTMVKLEGEDGKLWFINGNAEFSKKQGGISRIVSEYNSLISFDGYERIRNTLEYETINLTIEFLPDDSMSISSVTMDIDNESFEASEEELKYIGGGKLTYESF